MNKFYSLSLGLLSFLLCFGSASAQTTGSFDATITFNSEQRTLSLYVPPSYNPANPAKLMVCLHGLGDNGPAYRNALINSLSMQNTFTNTIFICPDGGSDQIKDFYTPVGDEAIIDSSIAYVAANYAIDQNYMILQGFSLGGRSALRYGYANPGMFRGLLLNTPAIQGTKEAVFIGNMPGTITHMPIYISHGANDEIYGNPIDSTFLGLVKDTANVVFNRVAGLGHTIPPMSLMPGLDTFFDSQTRVPYDVDLVEVRTPVRACQPQYNITALFRNVGSQPVTSIEFGYTINGNAATTTWTGNIGPFEPATLQIPVTAATAMSDITVNVLTINGALLDTMSDNNEKETLFQYSATPTPVTYTQDFETAALPAGWIHETAGDILAAWELDNTVGFNSSTSMFSFNTILVFDNSGRRENLYTPVLDLTGTTAPELTFDLTFNYHRFEPPVATATVDLSDTLEIAASADCGASWQVLYRKAGADLATFAQPIINPITMQAAMQVPTTADWRNERVSLSPVAGNNDVVVRMSYISGLGGWINIDNVSITPTTSVEQIDNNASFEVFPNPAHEQVTVKSKDKIRSVTVTDMQGKKVFYMGEAVDGHNISINSLGWAPGIYMMQVQTAKGTASQKLVIE